MNPRSTAADGPSPLARVVGGAGAGACLRLRAPVERSDRGERGAALIEFALVALVLYLLLGAVIELGRLVFAAQVANAAARTAARELALAPLPAASTFDEALDDPYVRAVVYDEDLLVIDLASVGGGESLNDVAGSLPLVNRLLLPLMISDTVEVGGAARDVLRFPGALVSSDLANGVPDLNPTGLTVRVPRVVGRDAAGVETVDWVDVLEEVLEDPGDPGTGPFAVGSGGLQGLVAVRVHVPFQAAMLSGYRQGSGGPFEPNLEQVNEADDVTVSQVGADVPDQLFPGSNPTYSGPFGLGRQYALGREVRPFRRLVTGQAVFRREAFAETLP